jgi:hypothetical protein
MHRLHLRRAVALAVALAGGFIALPGGLSAAVKPIATPTPTPTNAPGEVAAMTARVKAEFLALQSGKIDRTHYAKIANDALSEATLADLSKQLKTYGAVRTTYYRGKKVTGPNATDYFYTMDCEKGMLAVTFGLDASDKIAGLSVGPE